MILRLFIFFVILTPLQSVMANTSVLRIPLNTNSVNLDPAFDPDISSLLVARQINCQLIRNEGGIYALEAAKSIKYISPLQLEIKLSDSAKFYDGTQVRAEDVVISFDYLKSAKNNFRNIFLWVERFESLDQNTILVTLKKPMPQLLEVFSTPQYFIFKKEFLKKAKIRPSLWKFPIGCGGYKISNYKSNTINLQPLKKGIPIRFYLSSANQVKAENINNYDIISLRVVGNSNNLKKFNTVEIFDPSQVYIGLNTLKKPWDNKNKRCNFLSKLDTSDIINSYGELAKIANDFLPLDTLGYNSDEKFFEPLKKVDTKFFMPKTDKFCLSYLVGSIPFEYRNNYFNMIKKLYPNLTIFPIFSTKKLGETFIKSKCDALIISLKSGHFDGYDYLYIFGDNTSNFFGVRDNSIISQIEDSQYIENAPDRARKYRDIIYQLKNQCYIRPLITIPMRKIYIRKSLNAPDIGQSLIDSYYFGKVENK